MIPFLKALLWDQASARAALMALASAAALFYAQPANRSIEERLIGSALGAVAGAGIGAPSGRSKEAAAEIEALKARLDALAPPN